MSDSENWVTRAVGGGAFANDLAIARFGSEKLLGRSGFALTSPAFKHGDELDPSFTAIEEDAVAPPLEWSAPPPGTQEVVLIVEDADAPADKPLLHWLPWGFPGQRGKLFEGEVPPRAGKNARGNSEWLLPDPPIGKEHRYVFQLFALDLPLTLMPGATREDVEASIKDHVVACAVLTGRFEGHEREDLDLEEDLGIDPEDLDLD